MSFDFQTYIRELLLDKDKQAYIKKYNEMIEPIYGLKSFRDLKPYKEYLSKLPTFPYIILEEHKNDFDWNLLQQLVLGSFSSDAGISWHEQSNKAELVVLINNCDTGEKVVSIEKKISELWRYQVLHLFEIYCSEMINLELLRSESESECISMDIHRQKKIVQAKILSLRYDKYKTMAMLKINVEK